MLGLSHIDDLALREVLPPGPPSRCQLHFLAPLLKTYNWSPLDYEHSPCFCSVFTCSLLSLLNLVVELHFLIVTTY